MQHNIFKAIAIFWTAWQLAIVFISPSASFYNLLGGGDPEIVHFLFAVIAVYFYQDIAIENNNKSQINSYLSIKSIYIYAAVFGSIGIIAISDINNFYLYSITGTLGLIGLVSLVLTFWAALFGALVFIFGLIPFVLGQDEVINGVFNIINKLWSPVGIFGDGLQISVKFIFVFFALNVVLRRTGALEYFSRFFASLLARFTKGSQGEELLSILITGFLSGAASAALSVQDRNLRSQEFTGLGKDLSRAEQGGVVVTSSAYSHFTPPILAAPAFLIAESLDINLVDVIASLIVPSILVVASLWYFCVAAGWRNEIIDTQQETFKFVRGIVVTLLIVGLLAAISYLATGNPSNIEISVQTFVYLLAGLFLLQGVWAAMLANHPAPAEGAKFLSEQTKLPWAIILIFLIGLYIFQERPDLAAALAAIYGISAYALFLGLVSRVADKLRLQSSIATFFSEIFGAAMDTCRLSAVVAVALAFVGVVIAPVTLMEFGPLITDSFSAIAGGNLMFGLLLTAILTLFFGAALSTTASYFAIAAFTVPVLASIGIDTGVLPALISIHLFIFMFASLADVTPPDDIAVTEVSKAWGLNKKELTWTALRIALPAILLPFAFVGRNSLFLTESSGIIDVLLTSISVMLGLIIVTHVVIGHLVSELGLFKKIILVILSLVFILPTVFLKNLSQHQISVPGKQIASIIEQIEPGALISLKLSDPFRPKGALLNINLNAGRGASLQTKFEESGLTLVAVENKTYAISDISRNELSFNKVRRGMILEQLSYDESLFDHKWFFAFSVFVLLIIIFWPGRSPDQEADPNV